jgi:MFS transporter, FSR family, fosmidomycin resistance protein
MLLSAVPALLMGVCFLRVARAVPRSGHGPPRPGNVRVLLDAWRRDGGLPLATAICIYNMALMALLAMIPLYLAEAHGFRSSSVGLTFSALLVAGAVLQPSFGRMSDRIGRRPVLVLGNLLAALASAILVLEPSIGWTIAAITLSVAALDSIRSAMLAAAVDRSDHGESTTLGLAFVVMDGVGALGSVLAGAAAGISWAHMFALAAALSLGAAALSLLVPSSPRPT